MKILLLHASAGAGHRRAAEALALAFRSAVPGAAIEVRDILEFTPAAFRKAYADGYLDLVRRAPELWGYLYAKSDIRSQYRWRKDLRALFNKLNAAPFLRFQRDLDPDLVVCTHFMPLQLLSAQAPRGRRRPCLCAAVTDFAVHALWVLDNVDAYYVATDEARRQLIRRGQSGERVMVTGIPIDPVFALRKSREAARAALELRDHLPAVLVLGGGYGVGPALDLVRSFGQEEPVCRLLVVAGRNEKLRREIETLAGSIRTPVTVFGFVSNVHELMDASDLVVTKPGGLTTSEVLAKGKPMLIVDPIPGQEQRNCEAVLEAGAAARLFEAADACDKIRALLADRRHLARMSRHARQWGRPHAAAAIAADALARCRA